MRGVDAGRIPRSLSTRARPRNSRCLQIRRPCQPCAVWTLDDADDTDAPSTSTSTHSGSRGPSFLPRAHVQATPVLQAAPQRLSRPVLTTAEVERPSTLDGSSGPAAGAVATAAADDDTRGSGVLPPGEAARAAGGKTQKPQASLSSAAVATATAAGGNTVLAPLPPGTATPACPEVLTLEAEVKATASSQELQELLERHDPRQLSPQALILFCNQLSKVQKASVTTVRSWNQTQAILQQLLQALDSHLDKLNAYELIVLVAAVARLRHLPSQAWLSRFFLLCQPRLKECGTGNLTMLVRAVSSLGLDPWAMKEVPGFRPWWETFLSSTRKKMHAFRSDELIRLISSMADLKHKPQAEWMDEFNSALKSKLHTMDSPLLAKGMLAFSSLKYEPQRPLLKAYYVQMYSKLPMFDDQDLASTAQAFVVLKRIIKHDFLVEFLEEVMVKLPAFTPVTLANLLVALAGLARPHHLQYHLHLMPRFRAPEQLLRAMAERLQHDMWHFSGDCLANCLWGLTMLGYKPSQGFMDKCVAVSHTKLHAMRNEELTRMLVVLAAAKYQAREAATQLTLDSWYKEFTKLAARREYSMRQACDMLSMLAACRDSPQQQRHVTPAFVGTLVNGMQLRSARHTSATRLAGLARSLQALGYRPDFAFLHSLEQASRFFWTSFRPQEYADLLSAMSTFATTLPLDPLWVTEFLAIIQCRMDQFPPSAMSKLLSTAVDLPGVSPGARWMRQAVERVHYSIGSYTAPQLCNVVLALGRCRYRLPAVAFDSLTQHLVSCADELPQGCAAELSQALQQVMPSSLNGGTTHQHYLELQTRLGSPGVAPCIPPIHLSDAHNIHVSRNLQVPRGSSVGHVEEARACSSSTNGCNAEQKHLVATEGR